MNISITAQNIELTNALKEYAQKRLGKLRRFTTADPVVVVEIGKDHSSHKQGEHFEAKVSVTTALGKQYYAVSRKEDLYEAIDDLRSDIVRQLSSSKSKNATLFRRGAQKVKNILKGFRS